MKEPKQSMASVDSGFAALDTKALIKAIDLSTSCGDSNLDQLLQACSTALRREVDKSQRFLDTVETVIVGLDRQGRLTLINRMGCELLGYREDDLLGRNWFSFCLPEGSEEVELVFQRIMSGELKTLDYYENEVLTHTGERRMMAWHNSYMYDSDGAIIGTLSAGEDITARKLAEQRSTQLLEENRRLTQRLFTVQESERKNLARELHDEMGQWMSAMQAHAHLIADIAGDQQPEIRESANEIQLGVSMAFQNLRRMIRDLRPVMLDALGLEDSLAELVANWESHQARITCRLDFSDRLDDLDETLAITIYRIVQESLTNVANHAGAHQVEIAISRSAGNKTSPAKIQLMVSDDGKGITPGIRSDGMGILGMRERVLAAGGSFDLDPSPGRGVSIKVELPLATNNIASKVRRQSS